MSAGKRRCDLVIENGSGITMDDERNVFDPGALAITGNRIVAVGPQSAVVTEFEAQKVINARGGIVHPGFIALTIFVGLIFC